MEMQVIKTKSTLELQEHEEQLRAQLFALRIQKAIGKLDAPHMINLLRKDIARIKTELSFRTLNGEVIKPLNITKMVLPEEEKKPKKEKTVKAKKVKSEKTTKEVKKTEDTKPAETKEVKKETSKKEVKTTKTTPKKPAVKKTTKTAKPKTKEEN